MSGTVNKVILIGYLGDNVKLHYFEAGNCIGRFSLATHESYISRTTNKKTTLTEWHTIVVKNKAAETCEKYLSKGDKVYIEGRVKYHQWLDEKGITRYSSEIHAFEFTFLDIKKEPQSKQTESNNESEISNLPINDLPF